MGLSKTEELLAKLKKQYFAAKENINPKQWVEKYCTLPAKTSSKSGSYSTSYTPFVREFFNLLNDDDTQVIVIKKGVQLGLSLFAALAMTYISVEKQRHVLYYSINNNKVTDFAAQKFYPILHACGKAKDIIPKDKDLLKKTKAEFPNSTCSMESAGALSSFKSSSACYVFFDELDSSEDFAGEAPSDKLALDRITSYGVEGKIYYFSSPSDSSSKIDRLFKEGTQEYFEVPCPHCGYYQTIDFEKNIKFDESTEDNPLTIEQRADTARFECLQCHGVTYDKDKLSMMNSGKWVATNLNSSRKKRSFCISSLYSCDLTWSKLVEEFLYAIASGNPENLRHFRNSRLAEVYQNFSVNNTQIDVLKLIELSPKYNKGTLNFAPQFIGMGIDVQKDCLYYIICALDEKLNRHVIDYGKVPEMSSLEEILYNRAYKYNNTDYFIEWAFIDSNYRKEEVLQACINSQRLLAPCRGVAKEGKAIDVTASQLEFKSYSILRYDIRDDVYKYRIIEGIIRDKRIPLYLPQDTCNEFMKQITNEKIILKKVNGVMKECFTDTGNNHYGDCLKYVLALLDISITTQNLVAIPAANEVVYTLKS